MILIYGSISESLFMQRRESTAKQKMLESGGHEGEEVHFFVVSVKS